MAKPAPVYTYFLSLQKCFNSSASARKSLKIRAKVAEGFDFQTLQHCSACLSAVTFPDLVDRFFLLSVYRFLRTLTASRIGLPLRCIFLIWVDHFSVKFRSRLTVF